MTDTKTKAVYFIANREGPTAEWHICIPPTHKRWALCKVEGTEAEVLISNMTEARADFLVEVLDNCLKNPLMRKRQ